MQEQVIALYDELGDQFTPAICKAIMKPFIDTDMDSGGKDDDLKSKDGKSEEEIIVMTLDPDYDHSSYESWNDDATEEERRYEAYIDRFHDLWHYDEDIWKIDLPADK